MTKKRVLFVSHGHPHVIAGGAEVYAYELYCAMQSSQLYEPFFLARTGGEPRLGSPFRAIGADPREALITTAGFDYFYMRLSDKSMYLVHFADFLNRVRPDVVHFQHTLHLGYEMIQQVRKTLPHAAIVYTLHEYLPICNANGQMVRPHNQERCKHASPVRCNECFPNIAPSRFFMRERFIKSLFEKVDLFHAPSRWLLERYVDWGIPREKIEFLEYGRRVCEPVRHREIRDGAPRNRFGFFGQLNHYKGILVLLQAMEILGRRSVDGPTLNIHGANLELQPEEFQAEFRRMVRRCASSVTYAGRYQNEDLPDLMERVDWVVIPSVWWENSPLVIQEAFMHQRPIIAANIGGMAEKVQHDVDGLHFIAANPVDLAEQIERAATEDGLWERLAAGISPVYDVTRAVVEHDAWYGEILRMRSDIDATKMKQIDAVEAEAR